MLSNIQPPQQGSDHGLGRHRWPAYHRRQERHRAAKVAAGPFGQVGSPEVKDVPPKASVEEEVETAAEANVNVTETADKVVEGFPCDICDFTSSCKNGLAIHMSKNILKTLIFYYYGG